MDGKAFIFLNGFYQKGDPGLIQKLQRRIHPRPVLIAVDGGITILRKINIKPDYWIADLDSAPRIRKEFLKDIELHLFPSNKDKTDAELTLDFCQRKQFSDITLFGWYDRNCETDHMLGNLFLCKSLLAKTECPKLRFLDSRQEIIPVKNDKITLAGYKGHRLSILPLSKKIIVSLTGTKYPAKKLSISAGKTIGLRNQITAKTAAVTVQGLALVIIAGETRN
jgi:thiamine pyrophosphokinase